ncbi:MAG: FAD-binding oxidoreductase [Planctomycetota bacterium]
MSNCIERALASWRSVLNADQIDTKPEALRHYSRSTMPQGTLPAAILRPRSVEDVQAIARIATEFGQPIYPISRGKNWGYGDACAPFDGQVIVDLGLMNRIVEVNAELGYAVIEPGVTQQQLSDHLRQRNVPFWLDVTGAGPEASIVGNTLERGFGHTPYGDHYHASAGYEIVTGDGRKFTTGFGHYPNASSTYVFKPGIGPALDGLFTQSNLGIVTRMGVWLLPIPEYLQGFAFKVDDPRALDAVVEALRPLRLTGALPSAVHIANDLRVLSARFRYPWDRTGNVTPLPPDLLAQMRHETGLGAWNVLGGLYGTRASVASSRRQLRKALRGIASVKFFDERIIGLAERVRDMGAWFGLGKGLGELLKAIVPTFALLKGIPAREHLAGTGWRSRQSPDPQNLDPLDNRQGFYWISPIIPMMGKNALELVALMEPIFAKHRFEMLITMTSITPRALCCVTTVAFDKEDPEECARGSACYDELFDVLMNRGHIPYRVGIRSMKKLHPEGDAYWEVVRRMKQTLDPADILAPGRYLPGP